MDSEVLTRTAFSLLDDMQKSGKMNMFGAAPHLCMYLNKYFDVKISRQQCRQLLKQWMEFKSYWAKLEQETV